MATQLTATNKASKRSRWNKHPKDFLQNQQVEGWDEGLKDYIRKGSPWNGLMQYEKEEKKKNIPYTNKLKLI